MGDKQPYSEALIDSLVDHEKHVQRNNVCLLNLEDVRRLESNPRSREFKDTFNQTIRSDMSSLVFPVQTSTQGERSHLNLVHADGNSGKITFYGCLENEEDKSELESHTKSLAQKIYRKNGQINDFNIEWKSGYVGTNDDCAVTMSEGMKQLAQKKVIKDKNLSESEIRNIRMQHVLDMEEINKET